MQRMSGVCLTVCGLAVSLAWNDGAAAITIYGVAGSGANQRLVVFDSGSPQNIQQNITLSGVVGNELISQIDFRPATGQLYGYSGTRLYRIDTATGAATDVAGPLSFFVNAESGFDFDPVHDEIRVVVNFTQANLRINPTTGAVTVETNVAYAASDPRAGQTPRVAGTAFSNNVAGALTTTMYDLDLAGGMSTLATQDPNPGKLTTIATVGAANSFNLSPVGFDIAPTGEAFVAIQSFFNAGNTGCYPINLATGQLLAGNIIGGSTAGLNVRDIAIPAGVPEPATLLLAAAAVFTGVSTRRGLQTAT